MKPASFEARYHPGKMLVGMAISLAMIALSAFLIWSAWQEPEAVMAVPVVRRLPFYAALVLPLILLLLVRLAGRLFDDQPALRIDARGLLIRQWGERPIAWSEIVAYRHDAASMRHQLGLWLREPECHWPQGAIARAITRLNRKASGPHVTAMLSGLDRSPQEIVKAFESWLGDSRR